MSDGSKSVLPASKRLTLESGMSFTLRPLAQTDAKRLGDYFDNLSPQTKNYFQPHALDAATAKRICVGLNHADALRMVALAKRGEGEQIVGYFVMPMALADHDRERLSSYGVSLDWERTCGFAPSVANSMQSRGVGSLVFPEIAKSLVSAGKRHIVLLGGTQENNARALHYYQKHGFQRAGEFEHPPGVKNVDMVLTL